MRCTAASSALLTVLVLAGCSDDGTPGASGATRPSSAPTESGSTERGPSSSPTGTTTAGPSAATADPSGSMTSGATTSGPTPATPALDVCAATPRADLNSTFGGTVGDGAALAVTGATGACRWSLSGSTVTGRPGTVTVAVVGGRSRAQFEAAAPGDGESASVDGVGDVAWTKPTERTLAFWQSGTVTTVTASLGAYDPVNLDEGRLQASLVAFGALLAARP